jgi:hypothetical protein
MPRDRQGRRDRRLVLCALSLALGLLLPAAASAAPQVQPWMPSNLDSLSAWAVRARAFFRANTGDSIGGNNIVAYEFVAKIGRDLLRSLGRGNFSQAMAVEPVIDSLGLDVNVAIDPTAPYFALIMVHNPFRPHADVSGFVYWWAQNDLRLQGVRFESGRDLLMRVWHTAYPDKPYSWCIVENSHYGAGPLMVTMLRLSQNGYFWMADQYPGRGPEPEARGDAAFADLNDDGNPELVTWTQAEPDTLFTECMGCPRLVTESTWVERHEGFELSETRLAPSTYATFVLFLHLLRQGNRAAASRLLTDPSRVTDAIAARWDQGGGHGLWEVVNSEPGENWPHWMVVRRGHGSAARSWVIHFVARDGRWLVHDWIEERHAPAPHVEAR